MKNRTIEAHGIGQGPSDTGRHLEPLLHVYGILAGLRYRICVHCVHLHLCRQHSHFDTGYPSNQRAHRTGRQRTEKASAQEEIVRRQQEAARNERRREEASRRATKVHTKIEKRLNAMQARARTQRPARVTHECLQPNNSNIFACQLDRTNHRDNKLIQFP